MASNSPQNKDIIKDMTSELLEVSEVSESECDEKSEEKDNKRKYISSVSEQDISMNSSKDESKKQSKKKPKHVKNTKQETESNVNKDTISIKEISRQLSEINSKLSNVLMKDDSCLENMIEKIVGQMKNSLLHRIELLESKLFDRESENENLKKEIDKLHTELNAEKVMNRETLIKEKYENKEALNELEQYTRINNVVFHGLQDLDKTETPENTMKLVADVVKKHTGIQLSKTDIDYGHRLGRFKNGKCRPIVIKFVSRDKKIQIMKMSRQLKQGKIYPSEHLTPLNQDVFNSVRLKKRDTVESVWSRSGKIFYKNRDGNIHRVLYKQYDEWLNLPWPQK